MALPKRRFSRQRTLKKRTHWRLAVPVLSLCPQCKKQKFSHRVCPFCGYYKGREVLQIEKKEKKAK